MAINARKWNAAVKLEGIEDGLDLLALKAGL
jgi:hypothetical protein